MCCWRTSRESGLWVWNGLGHHFQRTHPNTCRCSWHICHSQQGGVAYTVLWRRREGVCTGKSSDRRENGGLLQDGPMSPTRKNVTWPRHLLHYLRTVPLLLLTGSDVGLLHHRHCIASFLLLLFLEMTGLLRWYAIGSTAGCTSSPKARLLHIGIRLHTAYFLQVRTHRTLLHLVACEWPTLMCLWWRFG